MKLVKRKPMPYEKKKSLYGYAFLSLWLFGVVFYFIRPLIDAVLYSFSRINITETGYTLEFIGLKIYHTLLREDPDFIKNFTASLGNLFYQVPVIIVFSFFIAVILNQKFHGRVILRAIFFIPVIVANGVIIYILSGDAMAQMVITGGKNSAMFQVSSFGNYLISLNLPSRFVTPIVSAAGNIFNLAWKSGIQILILLAGLQTVPQHLYEASLIDGATGWEKFWKITFPMVSPVLMLVFVYSVIDSFIDYNNPLMRIILDKNTEAKTEIASGMALLYCLCIGLIIGIIYAIVNRFIFYQNENT